MNDRKREILERLIKRADPKWKALNIVNLDNTIAALNALDRPLDTSKMGEIIRRVLLQCGYGLHWTQAERVAKSLCEAHKKGELYG